MAALALGLMVLTTLSAQGQSWLYGYDTSGNLTIQAVENIIPPQITGQPVMQVADLGDLLSFSVVVADASGTTFQWLFNGTNMAGATGDSLLLTNISAANGGQYSVMVSNSAGSITSSIASLVFEKTWNGLVSADWFNPGNWTPSGVPAANDTVNLFGTVNLTAPVTISGQFNWTGGAISGSPLTITSSGVLNLGGNAALSLYSPLTNAGTVNWAGVGDLIVYSNNGSYSGLIQNLAGGMWNIKSDRTMSPVSTYPYFNNAGAVIKSATAGTTAFDLGFYNTGTVTALSGTINFGAGGTIGGTYSAAAGTAINFSAGNFSSTGAVVGGAGLIQFKGDSLTLLTDVIANLPLTNGTLTLGPAFQGGTITNLTLTGSTLTGTNTVSGVFNWSAGVLSGSLTIATNGVLNLTGSANKTLSNVLTNFGTVNLSGSGVFSTANVTMSGVFNWSAGALGGPLTIASNGVMNLSGSASKFVYNVVTNAGTVNWGGRGALNIRNASAAGYFGAVENLAGALWDIQSDQPMFNDIGCCGVVAPYFHNAGTLRKSSGTGITTVSIPFLNSGTVTVLQGTLNFNGGGTVEGTFSAAASTAITFSAGSFNNANPAGLSGPGTIQLTGTSSLALMRDVIPNLGLTGGTVTLGPAFQGGTITNLTLVGSTLAGANTVSGLFNWSAGALGGPLTIASNGVMNLSGSASKFVYNVVTNAGTVNWGGSGALIIRNASLAGYFGAVENLAGALWDIQSDQAMFDDFGCCGVVAPYFHNVGTLRKSSGTGTTTVSIPLLNSGTVVVLQGALALNGGFTPTGGTLRFGITSLASYGRISFSGSATLDGTVSAVLLAGYVPTIGSSFAVLNYGSHSGTFSSQDLPAAVLWQTGYGSTAFNLAVVEFAQLPTAGRVLWLAADAGVAAGGSGLVSGWADMSGAGHAASQSVVASQPTLLANQLNGLPVLRLGSGGNHFLNLAGQVLSSQAFSIIAVTRDVSTSVNFRELISNWDPSYGGTAFFFGTTSNQPVRVRFTDNFGGSDYAQAGVGPISNPSNYFIFTGVSGTNSVAVYQNTNAIASRGTPLTTRHLGGGYVVGRQGDGTFDEYWRGDIAEILAYDRELSAAELSQVWQYLTLKYFVPPSLLITSALRSGNDMQLRFTSQASHTYNVLSTSGLVTPTWSTLQTGIPGNGGVAQVIIPNAFTQPWQFYRIQQAP